MTHLRPHRRPDGIIELRRRRVRDRLRAHSLALDAAILGALFVLCAASVTAVVATAVAFPAFFAAVAAFALPSVLWCGFGAYLQRAHEAPGLPPSEPQRPSVA
jgi:hypothetical protein